MLHADQLIQQRDRTL